jgi:hypothetical protein
MNPAEYVVHVFGGVRKAARALDRYPATISKWQHYTNKHGERGQVPSSAQRDILDVARRDGLPITADDLIYGRNVTIQRMG